MKLLKSFGIYTVSSFINKGIAFFLLPVFTKYLSPADYGTFLLFNNSVIFLTPFVGLSILNSVGSDYFKMAHAEFKVFFSTVLFLPLAVTSICLIVILCFGHKIASFSKLNYEHLFLIPLLTFLGFVFELLLSIIRNKNQAYLYAIVTSIKTFLELSIALLFIIYFGMKWEGRLNGWLIVSVAVGVYSLFYFRKYNFFTSDINKKYITSELKYSVPIVVNQVSIFVLTSSDKFFLAKFQNKEVVGIYGVASQIALIIFSFGSAIISTFYPYLYSKLAADYTLEAKYDVVKKMKLFMMIVIALAIGIVISTHVVYRYMIGSQYIGGEQYVKWIVLAYLAWFVYWMLLGFFYFFKMKRVLIVSSLVNISMSLLLNFYLIKDQGITGAIIALNICCVFSMLVALYLVKYQYKLI